MMMMSDIPVSVLVFTSIMLIPVLRIRTDLLKYVQSLLFSDESSCCSSHGDRLEIEARSLDLPVIRFGDLQARRHHLIDDTCFVCSVDYENEDVVTQLGLCKHVFHTSCLQKELHQHHFSCPFCRNSAFKYSVAASSSCKSST